MALYDGDPRETVRTLHPRSEAAQTECTREGIEGD